MAVLAVTPACKHRNGEDGGDSALKGAPSKGSTVFVGTATHFDGVSPEGSGCGTPPDLMVEESRGRFVALNVQDTPGNYREDFSPEGKKPRPINGPGVGMFDNGRHCGRWVKVTLEDTCSGLSNGSPGKPLCQNGEYVADSLNGAVQYFQVTDSCQDGNAWCRDDRYHVDLSTSGLSSFVKDGQLVAIKGWSNRRVRWEFVKAPDYKGDLKIGFVRDNFMRGAEGAWVSIIITNLPNGISRVEAKPVGTKAPFVSLKMVGDNGQKFDGLPTSSDEWLIRVYDYDGALINIGGKPIYRIKFPCGSAKCPKLFNEPKGGIIKQTSEI
jgi:hypothetical protein